MEATEQASAKFRDQEIAPSHTAEHLLNQTMVRMFGCGRAVSAHVERKKSKCDYALTGDLTDAQKEELEQRMNEVISRHLPVTCDYLPLEEAKNLFDLSKLPAGTTGDLRIVRIGDYDACPCVGAHVENTSELGRFKVLSSSFENGVCRLRWKLEG
ncbi:MAG: hypothetical protein MJZ14_01835 [Paludibacteraceae bacterium]|nr:hypothetical protein [Paludibacteraceae bacterium]